VDFPIVTALIGAWILFYHYSHQGPEVTLITTNAEGIEGVKRPSKAVAWMWAWLKAQP
jgi:paraquat-inducible protein B